MFWIGIAQKGSSNPAAAINMNVSERFCHINHCAGEYDLKYYCFESYSPKYDC